MPLFDARQNSMVAALFQQAVNGIILGPVELNLNRKGGGNVIIEAKGLPLHRKGESLLLGVARDITARKLAQEALAGERDALPGHISSTISDISYSCTAGPDGGGPAIDRLGWGRGAHHRLLGGRDQGATLLGIPGDRGRTSPCLNSISPALAVGCLRRL